MDLTTSRASDGLLTLREVCQELGLTLRAARFYEAEGLITPKRKGNRRLYSSYNVERLRNIVRLKALGLTLREIRAVLWSPAEGPHGLDANLCQEIFNRLSQQRADAEAGLALLIEGGCRCGTPSRDRSFRTPDAMPGC